MNNNKIIQFNTKRRRAEKKKGEGEQKRALFDDPKKELPKKEGSQNENFQEESSQKALPAKAKAAEDAVRGREAENRAPLQEERQKRKAFAKHKKRLLIAASILLVFAVSAYLIRARDFQTKYFPNTTINGIDASYKTPNEVRALIREEIGLYQLNLKSRENEDIRLSGPELGLKYEFDDALDAILADQKPLLWILHLHQRINYGVSKTTAIDESIFRPAIFHLRFMDKASFQEPRNAEIAPYEKDRGYGLIPSFRGSVLDRDAAYQIIYDSVLALSPEVDLASYDTLYQKPEIGDDDPVLLSQIDNLNRYAKTIIYYPRSVVLDGSTISRWLSLSEDGSVLVDADAVAEYVKTISETLDTVGKPKTLHTSYGKVVTIESKKYGWKVDQAAETAAILELLPQGETLEREPVYSSRAASLAENDYGNTYVEINLSAQHMHYYKDGQLVLESDLVSGNLARGHRTPPGIFTLNYKQRNAVLRGPGYASPVSYWMPFNGGIGLHDARWRSSFGGNIYKTSGSHGCINLPSSAAKQLYESIEKGCPVICYYLDGTEKTAAGSAPSAAAAPPSSGSSVPVGTLFAPEPSSQASKSSGTAPESSAQGGNETTSPPAGPGMIEYTPTQEIGPGVTTAAPSGAGTDGTPPDIQISSDPPKASGQSPATQSQDPAPTQSELPSSEGRPVISAPDKPSAP